MPLGMILLVVAAILIYLGVAQRVLDRMHLTDSQALLFIGAMIVGTFIPDLPLTDNVRINLGGGILPLGLIVYLLVKAGSSREKGRAVIALLVATALVYGAYKIIPTEPTFNTVLDPIYLFAILGGITGYLAGRSRRSAFIAGAGSILLTDVISRLEIAMLGGRGTLVIGGAGVFDGIILAGIIAVGLAEVVGETREKIVRGAPVGSHPEEDKANPTGAYGPEGDNQERQGGE